MQNKFRAGWIPWPAILMVGLAAQSAFAVDTTRGDVDALTVIGNKLREDCGGVPGGQSQLKHNVAGQVMPQPVVAPSSPPPPQAGPAATFSFAPNQVAGCPWYRPGDPDRPINGHLDESFGQRERWPNDSSR